MPPMKSTLLFACALLLIPGPGRADLFIDRNNLQQLKDAILEMNEATTPRPAKKAPKKKAPAPSLKQLPANKPASAPTHESAQPDAKPGLPSTATTTGAPSAPSAPSASPAAEQPGPTAAEIRAEHERIVRDSPSLEDELRRKHEEIVGNSPSMKENLERQHQKILSAPPPGSPSPAATDRQ